MDKKNLLLGLYDIIFELNSEIEGSNDDVYMFYLALATDGDIIWIDFMGEIIWDTESNDWDNIEEVSQEIRLERNKILRSLKENLKSVD